ncbi:MAG: 16S rRNA pseudouridine(516) synthase [Clostridia bacterium]|nr:16S rRNA pseudouridine(516) synthase [Clostridia bacterium]
MLNRIDKIISENLCISRKDAKQLISNSRVRVDGQICKKNDVKVDESSIIEVDNKKVNCMKNIYIMLNKPKGIVSAREDSRDITVVDILPDEYKRKNIFPAGRLDKDTVGFVLMTDDGDFAHKILSPKNHIEKTYVAEIEKNLSDEDIEKFKNGITLGDGTVCLSAKVRMTDEKYAEIKIVEGRYHQVKRMFASLGNKVVSLKRTSMGKLKLDENLAEGECRLLSKEELDLIVEK